MRVRVYAAAAILCLAPLAAAAQAPEPLTCLDLTLGPWEPPREHRGDSLEYALPSRVMLDTVAAAWGDGWRRMRAAPGALPSIHAYASWSRSEDGDTLLVSWSTRFHGVGARLTRQGVELRGPAETFTDVLPPSPSRAELRATPVDCSTPPRHSAAAQRPVPRVIPLADGDSIFPGMPMRRVGAVDSIPGRVTVLLRRPLAAPFADATRVEVVPTPDGRVAWIMFQLPPDADFGGIVRWLTSRYGPPSDRGAYPRPGDAGEWVGWANRDLSFSISRSDGPERWPLSVLLSHQRLRPN